MSFARIRGHEGAVAFLRRSIANGALAHAYIFAGPRGTGKFTAALEFTKAVNCAKGGDDACDTCAPCMRIGKGGHMDLVTVRPKETGGGEIEIDMIRQLQYSVGLTPYEMSKKVCIIDHADRMNQEASNALLKTLEEPPSRSVLILIVENLSSLLPTIASRCQVVKFFPLSVEELEEILVREHGLERPAARSIAHFAQGRIGEALRLRCEGLIEKKNRVIDALRANLVFDEALQGVPKEEAPWVLDVMLSWYRDLMMTRLGMDEGFLINIDRRDALFEEAGRASCGIEGLIECATEVIDTRRYLASHVNPKLAWAVLAAKIERTMHNNERS